MDSVFTDLSPCETTTGGTPGNTAAGTDCSRCVYPVVRPKSFPTDDKTLWKGKQLLGKLNKVQSSQIYQAVAFLESSVNIKTVHIKVRFSAQIVFTCDSAAGIRLREVAQPWPCWQC